VSKLTDCDGRNVLLLQQPCALWINAQIKSSSTWRFSEDRCMLLWLFTFSFNLLTNRVCMCNHTYKNVHRKIHLMCTGNWKFTEVLRHATQSLFYFIWSAIYLIILSFSVQVIQFFFINHEIKFKYKPQSDKG
jgi:hypothetical protein